MVPLRGATDEPESLHAPKLTRLQRILERYRPDIVPFVELYKDIHQHPELSCFEARTGEVIADRLRKITPDVKTSIGGHGVAAVLANGPGKTILLRAETDALPIEEKTGLSYASKVRMKDAAGNEQPVMHACGHDIHVACVLASLQLLHSASSEWCGTIITIFQPDEETPGGAQAMIDDGLYNVCPRPDVMLAQHVGMSKAGLVAVRTGPVLPASDYININIHSDGIGVNPLECPEPVSIATYLNTRFQKITATDINHDEFATLVCRDFHAGEPMALFTNHVEMRLETKTTKTAVRDQIFGSVKAITSAECRVYGDKVKSTVEMSSRAPVTWNDSVLAQTLQKYFGMHFGERFWTPPMDTPVEDFSILSGSAPVPFVYWKLDSTDPAKGDESEARGAIFWSVCRQMIRRSSLLRRS